MIAMTNVPMANPADRYKKLFESVQEAIVICDDEGHFIEVNPAACTLFELPQEQLIDKTLMDFTSRGMKTTIPPMWQELLKNGKTHGEYSIYLPLGRIKILAYNAVANFVPGRHVFILHDISLSKRNEELLKASEEQFRFLFEIMKFGALHIDKDGNIIEMNPAAEEILGVTAMEFKVTQESEIDFKAIREDGTPITSADYMAVITQLMSPQNTEKVFGITNLRDYTRRWLYIDILPIQNKTSFYVTLVDITKLREKYKKNSRMA